MTYNELFRLGSYATGTQRIIDGKTTTVIDVKTGDVLIVQCPIFEEPEVKPEVAFNSNNHHSPAS